MSAPANRLRSLLATAVTVGAIATSLVAVVILVGVLWWVRSLSPARPLPVAVPNLGAPRQAGSPPIGPGAPAAQVAVVPPAVRRPPPAPTALPNAVQEAHGSNDDAAKNRNLGAALSRLGSDPELQRRLREAASQVTP